MYVCMYATVYMWRSEDDSVQSLLAFCVYTDSWDQGHQAIGAGFYSLRHLPCAKAAYYYTFFFSKI